MGDAAMVGIGRWEGGRFSMGRLVDWSQVFEFIGPACIM